LHSRKKHRLPSSCPIKGVVLCTFKHNCLFTAQNSYTFRLQNVAVIRLSTRIQWKHSRLRGYFHFIRIFNLQRAMKSKRGEYKYCFNVSLTSALDEVGGQHHAPAAIPLVKRQAWWNPGPVWTGAENSPPTGIRSTDLLSTVNKTETK
jgi:hypothetical protein